MIRLKEAFFIVLCFFLFLPEVFALNNTPRMTPIVKIISENKDAVVNISTERVVFLRENPYWGKYGDEFDTFFERFFYNYRQPTYALKLKSVGSGVIIDDKGIVVTNAHVVNMASTIYIILNDGTQAQGHVMYEDPSYDLALIKFDPPEELQKIKLGSTEDLMIGESAVAIGNPLGLENTVTAGIISGKNRSLGSKKGGVIFKELIQTDAPINPGNSGGALLNLDGELIGINVAVVQNSQSIGFAIPVEKVKSIIEAYNLNKGISVRNRKKLGDSAISKTVPQVKMPQRSSDPFDEMYRMRQEMDNMVKSLFSNQSSKGLGVFNGDVFFDPNFDIKEENDKYIVKLDISGMDKDKMNIEINETSITVSGQRSEIVDKKDKNSAYRSKKYGSFLRTVPIPADADTQAIKTRIEKEDLIIEIPKK